MSPSTVDQVDIQNIETLGIEDNPELTMDYLYSLIEKIRR
jgi:hypothetical protein